MKGVAAQRLPRASRDPAGVSAVSPLTADK